MYTQMEGVVIDGLHTLFLGVTKLLLDLWFSDLYKACDLYWEGTVCIVLDIVHTMCYIISCITVTNVIVNIKVPDINSRISKSSNKSHWKG